MKVSRKKHNRNFIDGTKTQGGRPSNLALDLELRHFKGKVVELLLEIFLAIIWDKAETNTIEISQIEPRQETADS